MVVVMTSERATQDHAGGHSRDSGQSATAVLHCRLVVDGLAVDGLAVHGLAIHGLAVHGLAVHGLLLLLWIGALSVRGVWVCALSGATMITTHRRGYREACRWHRDVVVLLCGAPLPPTAQTTEGNQKDEDKQAATSLLRDCSTHLGC